MLASIILTAAIGGCPAPALVAHPPHHKRPVVAVLPLCTCLVDVPRTIVTVEAMPEPIELNILRYYVPLISDNYEPPDLWQGGSTAWGQPIGGAAVLPAHWEGPPPTPHTRVYTPHPAQVRAPEIDPSGGIAAVLILALTLLIICDRRSRP